ncbi:hypothetical protein ACFY7A_24250 [Streptomyces longwoodensis]|uniref:hypothetical protein n=1 Tax=Streptomyces longwoodensis TaxID=68231 RepID=UPI003694D620
MGRTKRALGTTAVTAAVLLLGACDATPSAPADPAPAGAPLSAARKATLHRAEERLVHRCMHDQGWTYRETPPDDRAADDRGAGRSFPYLVTDIAWAEEYGYGDAFTPATGTTPDDGDRAAPTRTGRAAPARTSADWTRALYGTGRQVSVELPGGGRLSTSDRGCLASARKALYGDLARWFPARRVSDNIDVFVRQHVRADDDFAAGVAAWSRCARTHGHDVASPGALRAELGRRTPGGTPAEAHAREVRKAVVEATCARSSGLARTLRQREAYWRPRVRDRFREELDELVRLERAALPRAATVLRTPAPTP